MSRLTLPHCAAEYRDEHKHGDAGVIANVVVGFFRLWHGVFRLKGAGYLLRTLSNYLSGLQHYPLDVPGVGTVQVDLRDHAGRMLLQREMGETLDVVDVETGLFKALSRVLKEDGVFWDIGANVGTVTTYVATTLPRVRIFAFEPNPAIARSVGRLFAENAQVTTFPYALSDRNSKVVLTIPKGKSVGGSIEGIDYVLKTSGLRNSDVEQVSVDAFAGDSLLEADRSVLPPDVVKIDVEGHEAAVVRGLTSTIAVHKPIVFFEHLYLSDEDVQGIVPDGYSLFSVKNDDGALTTTFDRTAGHNSVLMPAGS